MAKTIGSDYRAYLVNVFFRTVMIDAHLGEQLLGELEANNVKGVGDQLRVRDCSHGLSSVNHLGQAIALIGSVYINVYDNFCSALSFLQKLVTSKRGVGF